MKAGRKVLAGGMPVGTGNEMTVGTASGMAAVTANGMTAGTVNEMAAVTANEMAAVTASVTGVGRGGGVATQVPRERSENAIAAQIERRKMPKRNKVGSDEFKARSDLYRLLIASSRPYYFASFSKSVCYLNFDC